MKNYKKTIAAAGIMALLNGMICYAQTWEKPYSEWMYKKEDGQYAKNEWVQDTDGAWYFFNKFGNMETNRDIIGNYVGPDGKMLAESDTKNPLYGEKIYGTCYMKANSYQDLGDHYLVNATLYDSSFGTNEELGNYRARDSYWIEGENAYGTVMQTTVSTSGEVTLTVMYGYAEYTYTSTSTGVLYLNGEGEGAVLRTIKDQVQVTIPKNIEIVPTPESTSQTSLTEFLNQDWSKMVPLFKGLTVEKLYDDIINYAG